jgi:hypothetical protein
MLPKQSREPASIYVFTTLVFIYPVEKVRSVMVIAVPLDGEIGGIKVYMEIKQSILR